MNLSKSINTLLFNISNENKFFNSIVELKKEINILTNSGVIEEKSYEDYS